MNTKPSSKDQSSNAVRSREILEASAERPWLGRSQNASFMVSPFPPLHYLKTLPRPEIGSIPYGQVITSCTVPGTMALTFDDGPWKYTSDLLDLLQREHVRATFFVCGGNMANDQITGYGHPGILQRMLTSGHQVGSHTWAHPDLTDLDKDEVLQQIWLNERALIGVLGMLPTYFRPPYLSWDDETLGIISRLGYHVISLDVDTRDWAGDYNAARQNFRDAVGSGTASKMVLAHDIHEQTVYDLAEWMIDEAKELGYSFVTVGECLGDAKSNWYRNPYDGYSWQHKSGPHYGDKVERNGVRSGNLSVDDSETVEANDINNRAVSQPLTSTVTKDTVPVPQAKRVESAQPDFDNLKRMKGVELDSSDRPPSDHIHRLVVRGSVAEAIQGNSTNIAAGASQTSAAGLHPLGSMARILLVLTTSFLMRQ